MIDKRLLLGTFEDLPSTLLKVGSKGIDQEQMDKLASRDILAECEITPKKGHSYIHLITLGAGEYYGANANADWFNEKTAEVSFPAPEKDKTRQLDDGLTKYHSTYRKYGGVYHKHRNSKRGFQKQGEVVWDTYNLPMHRGEVVIEVQDDLKEDGKFVWHDALEKLANDEVVAISQGCSIPGDICSACGHFATTKAEHCNHIKDNRLKFHKSGRQIYMINDAPHFHDISEVDRPADRIALALEKVAAEGVSDIYTIHEGLCLPASLVQKLGNEEQQDRYELLMKLAKLEKEIPMIADKVCPADLNEDEENKITTALKGIPEEFVLDRMNKSNMLLTPRSFTIIVLHQKPEDIPGFDSVPGLLGDIFSRLIEKEDPNEILSDGAYKPVAPGYVPYAEDRIRSLAGLLSLDEEPVQDRVIKIALRGPTEKVAAETTPEAELIAREYARYQLSFLSSGKENPARESLVVLGNQR